MPSTRRMTMRITTAGSLVESASMGRSRKRAMRPGQGACRVILGFVVQDCSTFVMDCNYVPGSS
jgi:hypothetical protein